MVRCRTRLAARFALKLKRNLNTCMLSILPSSSDPHKFTLDNKLYYFKTTSKVKRTSNLKIFPWCVRITLINQSKYNVHGNLRTQEDNNVHPMFSVRNSVYLIKFYTYTHTHKLNIPPTYLWRYID